MSPDHPQPAIDVAIVNWNTSEAALSAADGYLASSGVEVAVTIIDNDSRSEERRLLEENLPPGVRLQRNDANRGYGSAINQALRQGRGDLVCASNADVVPETTALAKLASVALKEPRAGMVGPVFGNDTDRYHAALPSGLAMLGRIPMGSFAEGAVPGPKLGAVVEVGQPSGACFVVRRAVWEQLNGFDEEFFLWYEDVDLAKRLYNANYRNLVVGSAQVRHLGAGAFAQIDRRHLQRIRLASVERYIRKHHPRAAPFSRPMLRVTRRLRVGRDASLGTSASA